METFGELWLQPESKADMKSILIKLKLMDLEKIDKKVIKVFLIGFRVIVRSYEEPHLDPIEEADEEIILDWMSLYLDIYERVALFPSRRILFSKYMHITVTYIIGCIINVSNVSPAFYTNFLQMTMRLLTEMDETIFTKLEICGKGLISCLWKVIDKVGSFNTQLAVLNIIHRILTHFDSRSALLEVENFPNISAVIAEKIFNLLKVNSNSILYEKLSREILNEHNSQQGHTSLVYSFFCEEFCIGDKLIFVKAKHAEKFWFDINIKPYTLTFNGLLKTNCKCFSGNIGVLLRIKKLYRNREKLEIEYEPPVSISGGEINYDEVEDVRNAYAILSEIEMKRISKIFKANKLNLDRNQNPQKDISLKNNKSPNKFKKPFLDSFESAVPKENSHQLVFHIPSDNQRDEEIGSHDQTETKINGTSLKPTRFFKNPRPPKKINIPWKLSFSNLPIKVNKQVTVTKTGDLEKGRGESSGNTEISNVKDLVSIPPQKRPYDDINDNFRGKKYRIDTSLKKNYELN